MKNNSCRTLALVLLALSFCALDVRAQVGGQATPPPPGFDVEKELPRKEPGRIIHNPKMETAAKQMKWAKTLLKEGKKRKAMRAFDALVHEWHGSPEAPEAQFMVARLLYERGKIEKAFKEFQYTVEFFSGRVDQGKVVDYQFDIACQVMNGKSLTLGFFPGIATTEKAIPLFKNIVENAPSGAHAAHAQFMIGFLHETLQDYEEAISAYESVYGSYRKTLFAEEAAFRRAVCINIISRKARYDERLCRSAQAALGRFLVEYPESEFRPEAEKLYLETEDRLAEMYFLRGVFYDRKADNPRAAIIVYSDFLTRFPKDRRAKQARDRISILEAEQEEMNDE